ncbi:uncharacterized protein PG998_005674 [Apiospora kogelbergensis]|uniref:uncharacterized protein n=1 Tax=Apiospora kogelbergensis TaxID=1337665 RepID=UPI003131CFE2
MKSTFAAALLPLVASAVNAQSSKPAEYTYEIREFSAECNSYSVYCWYNFDGMRTSTNPDFSQGCSVLNTSESGLLPAVEPMQCGTYVISVGRPEGDQKGPVVLTVYARSDKLVGTYSISPDDLTIAKAEGGKTVQSYKGKKSITIEARKNPNSAPEPVSKHFTDPASTAPVPASTGTSAPGLTVSSP